jgi:hypothetical protein
MKVTWRSILGGENERYDTLNKHAAISVGGADDCIIGT